MRGLLLSLLVVSTSLLACSGAPSSPGATSSRITEALDFVPAEARWIGYTDWAALKGSREMAHLTSDSPVEEREAFYQGLVNREAAGTDFSVKSGILDAARHAETWGWDATDLEWELEVHRVGNESSPAHIARLREGFPTERLIQRLDDKEFSTEAVGDSVLRSYPLDGDMPWSYAFMDPAILNTAILADGRTLIMSFEADEVRAFLATLEGPGATADVRRSAQALDGPWAAVLLVGEDICSTFDGSSNEDPMVRNRAASELDAAGQLHPYQVVALGYSRDHDPIGRLIFLYDDHAQAAADLPVRRALADTGTSLYQDVPYPEAHFSVVSDSVAEGVIKFDVALTNNAPLRDLLVLPGFADLLPAACTP